MGTRLGVQISDSSVIALADHIHTALSRHEQGEALTVPLVAEVSYAFPAEARIARDALDLVRRRTGVNLPDQEAAAIALHVVNARFKTTDMPTTFQLTTVLSDILKMIEERLDTAIDPHSVEVARFATHLRFLLVRLQKGRPHADTSEFLWNAAKSAHPREHACAIDLGSRISEITRFEVNREEELYLTLHVLRLVNALG